ncbi:DoxX family protein [Hahella sp. HN01]|uniref:DoxX family protein n=1 Tax=Hahella sp. HN01 TaxID=2847262 RepID=UPI001C1EF8B3|nr:DoxX family protein [Hahella sp. HN01]MBU6953004.1 DoxX family protein [Hahella sp. HN01]
MINNATAPYAALLLRLSLGAMFIAHGLLKLLVFTPAGTAGFFGSLGLPGWFAYLAILAELGGGALLIIGYRTQWVALALTPILLGAIVFVHGANGWAFSAEGGGWEYPAFLLAASLVQTLLGDGAFSFRDLVSGKSAQRAALRQS